MKAATVTTFFLVITFLVGSFQLVHGSAESNQNGKPDYKSLKKSATLKIALYKWQLRHLHRTELVENRLERLKNKRREIERIVEKLEFVTKIRERKRQQSDIEITAYKKNNEQKNQGTDEFKE